MNLWNVKKIYEYTLTQHTNLIISSFNNCSTVSYENLIVFFVCYSTDFAHAIHCHFCSNEQYKSPDLTMINTISHEQRKMKQQVIQRFRRMSREIKLRVMYHQKSWFKQHVAVMHFGSHNDRFYSKLAANSHEYVWNQRSLSLIPINCINHLIWIEFG